MPNQIIKLWSPDHTFPTLDNIPMPDVMTHVMVQRAREGEYHYLHETSLAWHRGRLYVVWANSREKETNTSEEVVRWGVSDDGETFSNPKLMGESSPEVCRNHSVMVSTGQSLWCFLTRHDDGQLSGMEAFEFDDDVKQWVESGLLLGGFIPFFRNLQWSYPSAVEHEGRLYITYSVNKSDCGMTVIPVRYL